MTKYTTLGVSVSGVAQLAKALADEGRIRILLALRESELCVCELTDLLDLAPSTVSRHLSVLRQAGLVESRKVGRWVHVRRPALAAGNPRHELFGWIDATLPASDTTVQADCCRLDEIRDRALPEDS